MNWIRVSYLRFEDDEDKVIEIVPKSPNISIDDGENDNIFDDLTSAINFLEDEFDIKLEVPRFVTLEGFWFESRGLYGKLKIFVRRVRDVKIGYRVIVVDVDELGHFKIEEHVVLIPSEVDVLNLSSEFFEEYGHTPENDIELVAYLGSTGKVLRTDRIVKYLRTLTELKEELKSSYDIEYDV